jgi:hypothetical protein
MFDTADEEAPLKHPRKRFWVEAVFAALCAALTVTTLITREWIEEVFGVDPDGGSGAAEWLIVAALGVLAIATGLLARAERRRPVLT